jgi:very-short-patch-repair endonuclease
VYSPVSAGALRHFVHRNGGGDRAVAWVADRQLGLIRTVQLEAAGVGRGAIAARRERKLLHPQHRGVYLVGHSILTPGARALAAVLACGSNAYVSHASAAGLWGLIDAEPRQVEVIVAGRNCRSRPGIIVHKTRVLHPRDRTTRFGIPITSPARTLLDYAATAGYEEAERAIAEAFALKLLTEPQLVAAIGRAPHRTGVALVRAILGQPGGPRRTRSDGERAMLRLIRAAKLPVPLTNHPVEGFDADFYWPEVGLIVEVDGGDFHRPRPAFERDHRRDIVHKDAGHDVLRVSGQQLDQEPIYIAAVIARAYDRRNRARG